MGTLHSREKSKWSHDVRPENGKRAIVQLAVKGEAVLFNMEDTPLTAETGLPNLHPKRLPGILKLHIPAFQPPHFIIGNDLERRSAAPFVVDMKGGYQRERLSLWTLVL